MTMLRKFPVPANFFYPAIRVPPLLQDGRLQFDPSPDARVWISARDDGFLLIEHAAGKGCPDPNPTLVLEIPEALELTAAGGGDVSRSVYQGGGWRVSLNPTDRSLAIYFGESSSPLISLPPDAFGYASSRRMLLLDFVDQDEPVYGLGEKTGGLDKARRAYVFWNVDVVADHPDSAHRDDYEPSYVSIPLMITRRGRQWHGMLLCSVGRSWIHTGMVPAGQRRFCTELGLRHDDEPVITFCTEDEPLRLLVIAGNSLADVVRRLTRVTGTHSRPPRWALGYHQCRWGYRSLAELRRVANRLREARIPASALWLDIDYMDGWRVFTYDQEHFPDDQRREVFDQLRREGHRIVTIVDPGIKKEPGYRIHDEFHSNGLLCTTEEGVPYTGTVWPGATVFPDFTLPEARERWAAHIRDWILGGIDGIWNDMNDPSTGPITDEEMRFERGRFPHNYGHNSYGDLMAMATREGMIAARPGERPFILTRSGMTGIQRYAAVWTGDNFSNVTHLRMAIPQTLNLGLSGVAFNGPDVGGFCGDTTEALMVEWMLSGFLFPFFRNHSAWNTRQQEPYMFGEDAEGTMRRCIQTRLKILPYLEGLFAIHGAFGDPVLRPLCYEFPQKDYARTDDQFLVGPSVMMAPFLDPSEKSRTVLIPPGWWLDLGTGNWMEGPSTIRVERPTPARPMIYVRDGTILPAWQGTEFPADGEGTGLLDLHVVLWEATRATGLLVEDDGISLDGPVSWRDLAYTRDGSSGKLTAIARSLGYGKVSSSARLVFHGWAPEGASSEEDLWPFHGRRLPCQSVVLPG